MPGGGTGGGDQSNRQAQQSVLDRHRACKCLQRTVGQRCAGPQPPVPAKRTAHASACPHSCACSPAAQLPPWMPHPPVLKRCAQLLLRHTRLSCQNKPSRGFIQTMHMPRPAQCSDLLRRLQRMCQQSVEAGHGWSAVACLAKCCRAAAAAAAGAAAAAAAAAPRRRVAGHALGLAHTCQVLIFINHLQLHACCRTAGSLSSHSVRQAVASWQLHRRACPRHALQHLTAGQCAAVGGGGTEGL